MINPDTIIQEINQQVDGEALVQLFAYHADKLQLNGPTLKCFCPIHNELAFRSLIVNLKTRTYKCTMKRCAAFEGGTLVELWAMFTGKEPIEAALELVERLKLPIDLDTVRRLSTSYAEKGQELLGAGDVAGARQAIDQALAFDPRNPALRLFSARVWEAAGEGGKAAEERLQVLDGYLAGEDAAAARELLDELLKSQGAQFGLLERDVALTRREGRAGALKAALVLLADSQAERGETAAALGALEEAARLDGRDLELLERLARQTLEAGRQAEALELLARLTELLDEGGLLDPLLRILEWRAALQPQEPAIPEQIARTLELAGRREAARTQWLKLAAAHDAQGRHDEAQRILAALLERDPQNVELLQRTAEHFVQRGDTRRAVAAYRHLASLAQAVGEITEVGEFYDRARRIDPQDPALRRDQAEWRLKAGDLDGGLAELFTLADYYLERGEKDAGMAVLARLATLAPNDLDRRLRMGRCLERNGLVQEAYASYCQLARDFMRQQQYDAAQAICQEVRRLRPYEMLTLDLRIETHLALKQKAEAIESCRDAAAQAMEAGRMQEAEAALLRGIKIDRTETPVRTDLARLYEETGRESQAAELWIETALFNRGHEDFSQACVAAREALRLAPENREARVILAEGLESQGRIEEALEIWERLAEERSQRDEANLDAYEMFRHALTLAPRKRTLLDRVARLALRIEGAEGALEDVRRWLAALDLEAGRPDDATLGYRFAVEAYPQNLDWRTRLVELLLAAGERDEAAGHLDVLLGVYKGRGEADAVLLPVLEQLAALKPERLELRRELAAAMARQGHTREAAGSFEKLGRQYLREGQPEEALAMLEQSLAIRPEQEDVMAELARLYETAGQSEAAIGQYERLAELRRRQTGGGLLIETLEKLFVLSPSRLDLRAELADLYEMEGDLDRAVEHRYVLAVHHAGQEGQGALVTRYCQRIRSVAPEFIPARELLVESLLAADQAADARAELEQLGEMALGAGRVERAEDYFKRIQQLDPDDIGASERLGKLYEARGRLDEAATAFQRVLEIYVKLSETARAIGVLKRLKQLQPEDLELSRRLARMLTGQGGDRREAAEEWLGLIERALARGERAAAEAALTESLQHFAQEWPWRIRAAEAFTAVGGGEGAAAQWEALAGDALAAREYETAREAASQGLGQAPGRRRLRELRIEAHCRLADDEAATADLQALAAEAAEAGDTAGAEASLRRALELQPRREEVLEELAEILAGTGRIGEACAIQRRLAEIMRHGGRLPLAIQRARRIVELTPRDEESRDFLALLLQEADRADEAVAIWRAMAEECAGRGEIPAAIGRYARMLEAAPGDIDLLRRLADLTYEHGGMLEAMAPYDRLIDALHAAGEPARLEEEFLRILDLEPGHLQLKERLADFLHEQGRVDEARQALLGIITTYLDERGQLEDALRVMRHLKAQDPEDLAVREEEAVLLERAGRAGEAASIWRQLAATQRRGGQPAQCAASLGRAAELEGDNAEVQLEAARLLGAMGDRERAIHYYLRAIEIHDRHERLEECVPVLGEAIRLDGSRLELPDALARIYERLGWQEDALREWLALGTVHEGAGRNETARQIYAHIRLLLPGDVESRRRLARLCEAEGDRAGALRELHELAALAGREAGPELQAGYLKRILALDPGDEAALLNLADVWRGLGRGEELFETLGLLERHYATSGRLGEALATLAELKSLKPGEAELTGRTIDLLIKTGQAAEAARQGTELIEIYFDRGDEHHALETLRRIVEIEPANIERRIALARLVHAKGRPAEALQEFFLTATKLFGETRWEDCLRASEAGLELFPDEMRLRDLMARALGRLGRQGEAVEVQLETAALYDERGEEAKARRVYELILGELPEHQGTLEAMADWAERHGRTGVAVEHLLRLAECHYMGGRLDLAIQSMERIREMDPGRLEVRARLAETYLEAGNEESAVRIWMETAAAMVGAGRGELAIEIYERLLLLRPDAVEVMAALVPILGASGRTEAHERMAAQLGEIYLREGRSDEALALFADLSRRNPQDLASWERQAALHGELGHAAEAAEAYRHLYEIHRAQRRLEPARKCLEAALALVPGDPNMLELLGDLCLALGRRPEGVAWLAQAAAALQEHEEHLRARDLAQRILKLDPLSLEVRRLLAEELEATGDLAGAMEESMQAARGWAENGQHEPAIAILGHLLALDPMRVEARELYARLLQREGRGTESVSQYLILLGLVEQNDDPRRAIKYCRQILSEEPDHPLAHANLCEIYERTGKLRPALKECEWLADYHLACKENEEAERQIRKGLGWFPEELDLRTRLIEALIGQGRGGQAARQLAELATLAEARADSRMTEWAMAKACEIEPENLEHHCRLAEYQDRTGNQAGARQTRLGLIRLLLGDGRIPEARDVMARLLAGAGEDPALGLEIAELFERHGLPGDAAAQLGGLARQAIGRGEFAEARTLARRAVELEGRQTGARETLIEALRAQRELGAALEESERLYEIFDEAGEWDGALRTLQAMIDMAPSRPEPRRRLVRLYRKMRREEAMVEQLRRLAEIYVNVGELGGAIESLRELLDSRPEDTQARSRYIDLYSQVGDEEDLREDYLALARICMRQGKLIEATRAYEKVIALDPQAPACREEFVSFLFDQGQVHRAVEETRALADLLDRLGQDKDAGRVLDRALNYAPQELELRQRLAAVYMNTNRRGLALETYRTLARQFEHAGDEARLLEVVERIVEIDGLNVEFRQRLADLLAQQGQRDAAFKQYELLARQYEERGLVDLAEHEYRRLLTLEPDFMPALIRVVEIHLAASAPHEVLPEMKRLADHYAAQGQMRETLRMYRMIMEFEPESTEMLNCYMDHYMQCGLEQDLVEDYLRLADLKIKKGDLDEAIRIYKRILDAAPGNEEVLEKLSQTQRLSRTRGGGKSGAGSEASGSGNGRAHQDDSTYLRAGASGSTGPRGGNGKTAGAPGGGTRPMEPESGSMQTGRTETPRAETPRPEMLRAETPRPGAPQEASLAKVIRNYENLLLLNPGNPAIHAKLAEVLDQAGRPERADHEWVLAADAFMIKGEIRRGIEVYEYCLKRHPGDPGLQERLSKARVQMDSLRAIDGALRD